MASPPASPLSIAVVGAGGIGSTFAYHLARAGHDVWLVARPGSARHAQIARDHGIVLADGARVTTRVTDRLDGQADYDLIIVATPVQHLPAVLPALRDCRAAGVHFMVNLFEPEPVAGALPGKRCTFGMPFVMAHLDGEGRLHARIDKGRRTLHGDARWTRLFQQAGIPSTFEPRMALWLRCHAPLCIAFESTAFLAKARGTGATWRQCMTAAQGVHAAWDLIRRSGHPVYPREKAMLAALPAFVLAALLWSLSRVTAFRDLLAGGVAEGRALIDVILDSARDLPPSPPLAALCARVEAMRPL